MVFYCRVGMLIYCNIISGSLLKFRDMICKQPSGCQKRYFKMFIFAIISNAGSDSEYCFGYNFARCGKVIIKGQVVSSPVTKEKFASADHPLRHMHLFWAKGDIYRQTGAIRVSSTGRHLRRLPAVIRLCPLSGTFIAIIITRLTSIA